MKKTHFLNSCFFISCRKIVKAFLAFLQFNEADACTLLSAYGLYALEVDRLQNDRSSEQEEEGDSFEGVSPRKQLREPTGPVPIGIHPVRWSFGRLENRPTRRRP
jgi:hypothetical protein